jgi:hypothetical protein
MYKYNLSTNPHTLDRHEGSADLVFMFLGGPLISNIVVVFLGGPLYHEGACYAFEASYTNDAEGLECIG